MSEREAHENDDWLAAQFEHQGKIPGRGGHRWRGFSATGMRTPPAAGGAAQRQAHNTGRRDQCGPRKLSRPLHQWLRET